MVGSNSIQMIVSLFFIDFFGIARDNIMVMHLGLEVAQMFFFCVKKRGEKR